MKSFLLIALVLLVFAQSASAETLSGTMDLGRDSFIAWALGELEYPTVEGWIFVQSEDDSAASGVYGELPSTATLTVVGRDIRRCDLDLLSGRMVFAYGTFVRTGVGEGNKVVVKELTLYLLPVDPRNK